MILIIFLILIEVLTLAVLRQHFHSSSKIIYYLSILAHTILSLWFWILLVSILGYNSFFDNPDNVWRLMSLAGMIIAVVLPRILVITFHFAGWFIRRKDGGHIYWLTNTGLVIAAIMFVTVGAGTLHGRFNFKTDSVEVHISGLPDDLDGLKIVQISDLHLSGFYHHPGKLAKAMNIVNEIHPDILINTGDFVTFGWREFGRNDTILAKASGRYGTFAIMGNHDAGTYDPEYTEADRENNVLLLNRLVASSGYRVLNDENAKVRIGNAILGIIGVKTGGRFPEIVPGDLEKAVFGLDSVDLRILLTHDPNHWTDSIGGKRKDITLTLSGHTHGMQMGIMTKKIKWSPAKYIYPHWNGLYSEENQYHYVNRGLGVLAIPFRVWMPPEITLITLKK